jgi:PEP-CTERM motif
MLLRTLAGLVLLAAASPAFAETDIDESFDSEGNDDSVLNWPGNGVVNVQSGSIDLVQDGDFGIRCAGNSGSCVDLDGSTTTGATLVSNQYTFQAGQLVNLLFDISGNQRGAGPDDIQWGYTFAGLTRLSNITLVRPDGTFDFGSSGPLTGIGTGAQVAANAAFSQYGLSFRARDAGALTFSIANRGTGTDDNRGPLLDNLRFSIAAVPEPGTWAMMILGFGLIGGALRTRKRAVLALA